MTHMLCHMFKNTYILVNEERNFFYILKNIFQQQKQNCKTL